MDRENALLGAVLVVVAASALFAVVFPGVLADPGADDAPEPEGRVTIAETTIAAGNVSGASATLTVDAALAQRGGPVENVSIRFRATDTETGLVEATTEREVGTLAGENETRVAGDLRVPRASGYRIDVIVYEDDRRTASARRTVEGVGSLTPAYADTNVEFHRFGSHGDVPSIEYAIASSTNDSATLNVSTYLTNGGDEDAADLRVEFKARQSGSNVVADTETVAVDAVGPGSTASPDAQLTVPSGYDYYLDAVLWKGDTVVETTRSTANLGPGNLTVNETRREGGIRVSDFDESDGSDPDRETEFEDDTGDDADGQPGFGAVAAAVALAVATLAIAARRRFHD